MKKIFIILLLLFFISCRGEDGKDGEAYLQFKWVYSPLNYWDSNFFTPTDSLIYSNTFYKTNPGTYSFRYTAWDDSTWVGFYNISINSGEKGSTENIFLPKDGKNGKDKYYTLKFYSIGPLINEDVQHTLREFERGFGKRLESSKKIYKKQFEINIDEKIHVKYYEELKIGNSSMSIEYWKIN